MRAGGWQHAMRAAIGHKHYFESTRESCIIFIVFCISLQACFGRSQIKVASQPFALQPCRKINLYLGSSAGFVAPNSRKHLQYQSKACQNMHKVDQCCASYCSSKCNLVEQSWAGSGTYCGLFRTVCKTFVQYGKSRLFVCVQYMTNMVVLLRITVILILVVRVCTTQHDDLVICR